MKIKESELKTMIKESISKILLEAFKSNKLRDFFKNHGGVDTYYRQFSLGDISDEQINYYQEMPTHNDAIKLIWDLKRPDSRGIRSDADMKSLFQCYTAKDGTSVVVGIDRKTIKTGSTWGGAEEKKVADRLMSNGWNFKTRDNRYVDDSDTYYYNSPAKDFGLYNSDNYKGKLSDLEKQKGHPDYDEYRREAVKNLKRYMQRWYPNFPKK
jgi:hypothetical protein